MARHARQLRYADVAEWRGRACAAVTLVVGREGTLTVDAWRLLISREVVIQVLGDSVHYRVVLEEILIVRADLGQDVAPSRLAVRHSVPLDVVEAVGDVLDGALDGEDSTEPRR